MVVFINQEGFLCRKQGRGKKGRVGQNEPARDWYLVKMANPSCGIIRVGGIHVFVPKKYIGKRVRFKVEMLK